MEPYEKGHVDWLNEQLNQHADKPGRMAARYDMCKAERDEYRTMWRAGEERIMQLLVEVARVREWSHLWKRAAKHMRKTLRLMEGARDAWREIAHERSVELSAARDELAATKAELARERSVDSDVRAESAALVKALEAENKQLSDAFRDMYLAVAEIEHITGHSTDTQEMAEQIHGQVHTDTVEFVARKTMELEARYDALFNSMRDSIQTTQTQHARTGTYEQHVKALEAEIARLRADLHDANNARMAAEWDTALGEPKAEKKRLRDVLIGVLNDFVRGAGDDCEEYQRACELVASVGVKPNIPARGSDEWYAGEELFEEHAIPLPALVDAVAVNARMGQDGEPKRNK